MINVDDIKKSINILNSSNKNKLIITEQIIEDNSVVDNSDTKVEVSFKGLNNIDVNMHATSSTELNRLMDLAGIYHNEKNVINNVDYTNNQTDYNTSDISSIEPVVEPDIEEYVDDLDNNIEYVDDIDVPSDNINLLPEPEYNDIFSDDEQIEEVTDITAGIMNDYGHPDNISKQAEFDLDAYSFAGHGSKDVRYVPARSGDNAMDDSSNPYSSAIRVKGLNEYIKEVEDDILIINEKKTPEEILAVVKSEIPVTLDNITQQKITTATDNIAKKPGLANLDSDDIVNDVADTLNPNNAVKIRKAYDSAKLSGDLEEHDNIDGYDDDLEEARYKHDYSFRNSVFPLFKSLTTKQKLHRRAINAIKHK